jgi:hypothetical protein
MAAGWAEARLADSSRPEKNSVRAVEKRIGINMENLGKFEL